MERIAVIDCRADNKTVYNLERLGIRVIPTIKIDCLYDAIATHADIQLCYLGNNRFVCAPEVFEYYKKHMPEDSALIKGIKKLGGKYPADICYNCAVVGKYLICNEAYTAQEILCEINEIINVRQGYSKCSVCVAGENAIITEDTGIAKASACRGINTLLISRGGIRLRSMDYGFIGGATGLIGKNLLAVNGDIRFHKNAGDILKFLKKHNTGLCILNDGIPEDIGSVISNFDV